MRALLAIAMLALPGAALLAGCGRDLDEVERRPSVTEPGSSPELGRSPGATALAWWEALRARDPEAAVAQFTPHAKRTLDLTKTREAVTGDFGQFAESTEPHILYTERDGETVTVYMRIDGGQLVGPVVIKRGSLHLALPLVQRDGVWLVDNSAWLRGTADAWVELQDARLQRQREVEARQRAREAEEDK